MNTNKTQILHAVKFYVKRPNLRSGFDCMKLIINKDYGTNAMKRIVINFYTGHFDVRFKP